MPLFGVQFHFTACFLASSHPRRVTAISFRRMAEGASLTGGDYSCAPWSKHPFTWRGGLDSYGPLRHFDHSCSQESQFHRSGARGNKHRDEGPQMLIEFAEPWFESLVSLSTAMKIARQLRRWLNLWYRRKRCSTKHLVATDGHKNSNQFGVHVLRPAILVALTFWGCAYQLVGSMLRRVIFPHLVHQTFLT